MKCFQLCVLAFTPVLFADGGCESKTTEAERNDSKLVRRQQLHYQKTQPLQFFDHSIPRDVYQQIYAAVTTRKVTTYTVVETMTGEVRYRGPSIGYPIPADTSVTNPLLPYDGDTAGEMTAIEQAEPNGLFSSKNTDATWILYVDEESGVLYPVYSEHKAMSWPFIMQQTQSGEWVKASGETPEFTIEIVADGGKKKS